MVKQKYCSQCGKTWRARACGPTHALLAKYPDQRPDQNIESIAQDFKRGLEKGGMRFERVEKGKHGPTIVISTGHSPKDGGTPRA